MGIRACPAVLSTLNRARGGDEMPSNWNHFSSLQEAFSHYSKDKNFDISQSPENGVRPSKSEQLREMVAISSCEPQSKNLAKGVEIAPEIPDNGWGDSRPSSGRRRGIEPLGSGINEINDVPQNPHSSET